VAAPGQVIGQIYAARLHEAGHDVTVLARHRTLETLARDGITLVNGALVNRASSPDPGPGAAI
jgi:ketopantoate reductase